MKSIAILGASGHGKVVAEIAELCGFDSIIFFDDNNAIKSLESWKVIGDTENLLSHVSSFDACFVAIGDNNVRVKKTELLKNNNANIVSLIHPNACVSEYSLIKKGTVVMANASINPYASIGESCIVNTSSTIEHDCLIGSGVHISPNTALAGGVRVGDKTLVGIGSSIRQNIEIGDNVIIGTGSVVINNMPDNVVAFGVPAKIES